LLSALVISLTGWALLRDVASGLADSRRVAAIPGAGAGFEYAHTPLRAGGRGDSRRVAAISEARSGFEYAQTQLDATVETEPATQSQTLTEMVDSLTSSRGAKR